MEKHTVNPWIAKPEVAELFKNAGLDTNFKQMYNALFKRADVVSELVPAEFPMAQVTNDKMHLIVMDAKQNIENIFIHKETDKLIARYFVGNDEYIKIDIYSKKLDDEDGFNYTFFKSEKLEKAFQKRGKNIEVAVNQIVQMVAVLIGLMVDGYALKTSIPNVKIRTKNSFKEVGSLNLYSRVNGTYITKAYPYFNEIDWEIFKAEYDKSQEQDEKFNTEGEIRD